MINDLSTLLRGHIAHHPKLEYTKNNKPYIRLYINTKRLERKGEEYQKRMLIIPVFFYGARAEHVAKYYVKGQKVIINAMIGTYTRDNEGNKRSDVYLYATNIDRMESSENATDRQKKWEEERKLKEKNLSQNEDQDNQNDDDELDHYMSSEEVDENMFKDVTIYDISERDIGF